MSDRLPIPEIDDKELREHILRLRGLVAEETIETLRMVRLEHIVDQSGKIREYDNQAFRAWVIAWLNSLETVICAHMALMTKRLFDGEKADIVELVKQPERLLDQVEDIKRALEIILHEESAMEPEPVEDTEIDAKPDETGEHMSPDAKAGVK